MTPLQHTVRLGKEALRTGHLIKIEALAENDATFVETSIQVSKMYPDSAHVLKRYPFKGTETGETRTIAEAVGEMLELLCEYHPYRPDEVFSHVITRGEGVVVEFNREDFPIDTVHTGTYSNFVDHLTQKELDEQRSWRKAQAAEAKIQNEATFQKLRAIRPVWKAILEANDVYYTREQADKVLAEMKE